MLRGILLLEKNVPSNAIISAGGIGFTNTTLNFTSANGGGIDALIRFFAKWNEMNFIIFWFETLNHFTEHEMSPIYEFLILYRAVAVKFTFRIHIGMYIRNT